MMVFFGRGLGGRARGALRMTGRQQERFMDIAVDGESGWGLVTIRGPVTVADMIEFMPRLWAHPQYGGVTCALWDFSGCLPSLDFGSMLRFTDFIAAEKHGRGASTLAIVAPADLEFGLSRMFGSLIEHQGFNVNIFRSREPAVAWLQEQSGAVL
jgi:hypothetical protein